MYALKNPVQVVPGSAGSGSTSSWIQSGSCRFGSEPSGSPFSGSVRNFPVGGRGLGRGYRSPDPNRTRRQLTRRFRTEPAATGLTLRIGGTRTGGTGNWRNWIF